jgi:hypothetical protein
VAVALDGPLEETSREELNCGCGCGRRFVLVRGRFTHEGRVSSFVGLPALHDDARVVWLAIGEGREPSQWTCLRTALQGENVAAGIVEPNQSPLGQRVSPVLSRAQALADAPAKARLFAVHDHLLARQQDLKHALFPDMGRDFSFKMPDCVFAQPAAARSPRNQQNFAEHGDRKFVRALLPVPVSDGGELRVGLWLEVTNEAFFALLEAWDDPTRYLEARLEGAVENKLDLAGGGLKGAPMTLAARNPDQCLFVQNTGLDWLQALMKDGISARDVGAFVGKIEANMRRQGLA